MFEISLSVGMLYNGGQSLILFFAYRWDMYIANWFPGLLLISSLTSLSLIAGCGSEEDAGKNADDNFFVVSENNDANQITVPVNSDDEIQESTPLQPVPNPVQRGLHVKSLRHLDLS